MASVARDMGFAIGELGIDVLDHGEHHAGRELLGLLVTRPVLNVAEPAHYAQAGSGSTHCRYEIFRRQNLQILGWTRWAFLSWFLSGENQGANCKKEK